MLIAWIVYLCIPLIGFLYYRKIVARWRAAKVAEPAYKALLVLFFTYGGLLLVILTELTRIWSGMASLGFFYLILGAPFIMGRMVYKYRHAKPEEAIQQSLHNAALAYFIIAPILLLLVG